MSLCLPLFRLGDDGLASLRSLSRLLCVTMDTAALIAVAASDSPLAPHLELGRSVHAEPRLEALVCPAGHVLACDGHRDQVRDTLPLGVEGKENGYSPAAEPRTRATAEDWSRIASALACDASSSASSAQCAGETPESVTERG